VRTVDQTVIRAPVDRIFDIATDVERWPSILPHYRRVRFLDRRDGGGTVDMAAWRPFGALRYPVWWVSEMTVDRADRAIRYRHVRGITAGMSVLWRLDLKRSVLQDSVSPSPPFRAGTTEDVGTVVTIVHEWRGPAWPLVGPLAASLVIGPVFIHGIASRTLAGIKREAERT
jgi:uncharacterized membrane protein